MKTVYVVMNAEFVHPGHINIIQIARALGEVTVGIATDAFATRYKRLPLMSYEQRKIIIENIQGVKRVIPQDTLNLAVVLQELKPDYFVHGDDWKTGRLSQVRAQVLEVLREWGGQLIEPPYTEGISSTQLNAAVQVENLPANRLRRFRRLLTYQPVVHIVEVYDILSASIADPIQVNHAGKAKGFDALYLGLASATRRKGLLFSGTEGLASHLETIHEILRVAAKPLLVEESYLAALSHFPLTVKTLERLGIAGVVVEDKTVPHSAFVAQIAEGKNAQISDDFSILVQWNASGLKNRTDAYLERAGELVTAGADAFLVHVEPGDFEGTFAFCQAYAKFDHPAPLLLNLAPNNTETHWAKIGVRGFFYREELLRAAQVGIQQAAEAILHQTV